MIHCRDESAHELGRVPAPELKRYFFDKDDHKEKSSGHVFLLAIRKKPKAYFASHKIYRDQDLTLGVFVEVYTIFLSRQWELVCVRLGELEAEPLQTHPADLTVLTRHDNLFDEIVHLVPIKALDQRHYHFISTLPLKRDREFHKESVGGREVLRVPRLGVESQCVPVFHGNPDTEIAVI